MIKTKEMIVDYRKRRTEHAPILIDRAVVEQVESLKFLGVHITNKLEWSKHTTTVVKRDPQKVLQQFIIAIRHLGGLWYLTNIPRLSRHSALHHA